MWDQDLQVYLSGIYKLKFYSFTRPNTQVHVKTSVYGKNVKIIPLLKCTKQRYCGLATCPYSTKFLLFALF